MDRPIAVQSPSGMIYPPSVIKKKAPPREYGSLELRDEEDRKEASKCFEKLINLHGVRSGSMIIDGTPKKDKQALERMLWALAHTMLGEDWSCMQLC